ncbi:ferredoxin [Moritella marina ATCC 15381]|uniref:Ferredoxin n=1 Tax=Moritella marina ATCC 15381 TaxID=1202962 RepID=A0A5J6WIG4_MORMI|nr:ferredoxin [Moritella marina ATCC 15381]
MTYFVGSSCVDCKDQSCVNVCPVDAFHDAIDMLVINPDLCISCSSCETECPEFAISNYDSFQEEEYCFIEINKKLSKSHSRISS